MSAHPAGDDRAIRDLLASYALALDTDDIDRCLDLFADDGEFVVFGRSLRGRDQIRAMFESAPRGLHLTGVSSIDVSGDAATARSQVLLVEAGTLRLRPALFDDELSRDGRCWRFRRRRCRFITSGGLGDRPEGPLS
ncbi:MAG: nuclear transport factor 2 family protein [Mycobacterium sp.]|nr:nuclear transport factor 2 family protein [Mycobacterium sp.]MBV9723368.1 nuclear transport factor 2 family protein [Mycobacterium sp.]